MVETDTELRRHRLLRRIVDILISDLVSQSARAIAVAAPAAPDDVRRRQAPLIELSPDMAVAHAELKEFLYRGLYRHSRLVRMFHKAERVLTQLFEAFESDFRQLPQQARDQVELAEPDAVPGRPLGAEAYRIIVDYLAGMTDRYALQEHERLSDPSVRA